MHWLFFFLFFLIKKDTYVNGLPECVHISLIFVHNLK